MSTYLDLECVLEQQNFGLEEEIKELESQLKLSSNETNQKLQEYEMKLTYLWEEMRNNSNSIEISENTLGNNNSLDQIAGTLLTDQRNILRDVPLSKRMDWFNRFQEIMSESAQLENQQDIQISLCEKKIKFEENQRLIAEAKKKWKEINGL